MEFLFIIVVIAIVFALFGSWVAGQKNRDQGEGATLGCIFGPFGVLIEALLPTLQPPAPPTEAELTAQRERERQRREKLEAEARAFQQWREARERELAEQREAQARWLRGLRDDFVGGCKVVREEYKALWEAIPDWVKMTALGLVIGVILCLPFVLYWSGAGPAKPAVRRASEQGTQHHIAAKTPRSPSPF
jgi:hypothetical protein